MSDYTKLAVWNKSMDLAEVVYQTVDTFPRSEVYGLVSQMKRCSISIPSNIAEGSRRGSVKEFRQFLFIAFSSGAELETQVLLAKRLNFVSQEQFIILSLLLEETMKMLNVFISKLQTTNN